MCMMNQSEFILPRVNILNTVDREYFEPPNNYASVVRGQSEKYHLQWHSIVDADRADSQDLNYRFD
jgi:hypothetical protein